MDVEENIKQSFCGNGPPRLFSVTIYLFVLGGRGNYGRISPKKQEIEDREF